MELLTIAVELRHVEFLNKLVEDGKANDRSHAIRTAIDFLETKLGENNEM